MGLLGETVKAGARSGLRVFGRREPTQPSELEKLATETVKQLAGNNTKLMDHVETLMQQHGELAKLLMDAIKQMHGMGGG